MEELIALGRELQEAAEPGFFETRTQAILSARFIACGFRVQEFPGMTGFAATIDGRLEGKRIALVADMDALPAGGEPSSGESAPDLGAYAHTCGHHLQMTALFGSARLLAEQDPGLLAQVAFLATPAEEYVDLERREGLRQTLRRSSQGR